MKTTSGQVCRLFWIMSRNCEFHPLTFKRVSDVFRSVHGRGSRRNEFHNHVEARWVSRGKVQDRVFQLWQDLRVFLLIKNTQFPLI